MIFVTVGSMLPFDRLIAEMDRWSAAHSAMRVFAQIGSGAFEPKQMRWERMVPPQAFEDHVREADLIVAHAGMGSVITAAEFGKPIVLVPRYAAQREHTTDHQVHTADWLRGRPGIHIATRDDDLGATVEKALGSTTGLGRFGRSAPDPFLAKIRQAILSD